MPILLIENHLVSHNRSNQSNGVSILVSVVSIYLSWVLYIALSRDHWVYPILEVLSWPLRASFILGSGLLMIAFYYLGDVLYSTTWSKFSMFNVQCFCQLIKIHFFALFRIFSKIKDRVNEEENKIALTLNKRIYNFIIYCLSASLSWTLFCWKIWFSYQWKSKPLFYFNFDFVNCYKNLKFLLYYSLITL